MKNVFKKPHSLFKKSQINKLANASGLDGEPKACFKNALLEYGFALHESEKACAQVTPEETEKFKEKMAILNTDQKVKVLSRLGSMQKRFDWLLTANMLMLLPSGFAMVTEDPAMAQGGLAAIVLFLSTRIKLQGRMESLNLLVRELRAAFGTKKG